MSSPADKSPKTPPASSPEAAHGRADPVPVGPTCSVALPCTGGCVRTTFQAEGWRDDDVPVTVKFKYDGGTKSVDPVSAPTLSDNNWQARFTVPSGITDGVVIAYRSAEGDGGKSTNLSVSDDCESAAVTDREKLRTLLDQALGEKLYFESGPYNKNKAVGVFLLIATERVPDLVLKVVPALPIDGTWYAFFSRPAAAPPPYVMRILRVDATGDVVQPPVARILH